MTVLPAHMCVHNMCSWCPRLTEERVRSLGTAVTDRYDMPNECRQPSLGPMQEQQVLLTTASSLHSPKVVTLINFVLVKIVFSLQLV